MPFRGFWPQVAAALVFIALGSFAVAVLGVA